MPHPTKRSALACLNKKRLIGLAAEFEVAVAQAEPKAAFVEALAHSKSASFSKLLEALPATELRLICRAHELAISGAKAALVGRIRGDEAGGAAQTSLLGGAEDEAGEEALAAVFARAVPSIAGLVPLLNQRELAAVLRRLEERHHVAIDLTGVVGVDGLAAALTPVCGLPTLLAELDRYALRPRSTSHEDQLRAILAAAAGVTEDEALELEAERAQDAAPKPTPAPTPAPAAAPTPAPAPADAYRAALDALPRGVLHRVAGARPPAPVPRQRGLPARDARPPPPHWPVPGDPRQARLPRR